MATDMVRNLSVNITGSTLPGNITSLPTQREYDGQELQDPAPESRFPWSEGDSGDIDIWLGGDTFRTFEDPQNINRMDNTTSQQGPELPGSSSMDSTGFWYMAAMMLPLFSFGGVRGWRCSPSVLLSTIELLFEQVVMFCRHTRSRFQTMSGQEAAQDVFAGAMDIILLTYAVGFFLLTLYHASVFGRV